MGTHWCRVVLLELLVLAAGASPPRTSAATATAARRPSVLFCAPAVPWNGGGGNEWVDLDYLALLHNASSGGFEVDYTESEADLNRSRIFQYNALVLFRSPRQQSGPNAGHYDPS